MTLDLSETIAQFIGTHGIEIFLALLVAILLAILLLWRLFEAHYTKLWHCLEVLWQWFDGLPFFSRLRQKYPKLWSFWGKRLSAQGYLGLYLILGLFVIVVAVNVFGELVDIVVESSPLVQFDKALAVALHQNVGPPEVTLFRWITMLGGGIVVTVIGLAVGITLFYYRQVILLIGWATAIGGGSVLNVVLKEVFQRTRPELPNPFIVESTWSFPSGHAMGAVVVYGMLTYLLTLKLHPYLARPLIGLAVALILLIGFSRLFLGVHFFTDVVAGYVAGVGWLVIAVSGTEVGRRRKQARLSTLQSSGTKNKPVSGEPNCSPNSN